MSFVSLPKKPEVAKIEVAGCELPALNLSSRAKSYEPGDLLARLKSGLVPDAIVSWLFCARYDVFDIAERLVLCGYRGRVIAVSPPLPDKAMVLRELNEAFPMLHFDIWFSDPADEDRTEQADPFETVLEYG